MWYIPFELGLKLFIRISSSSVMIASRGWTVFIKYLCHLETTPFQIFKSSDIMNIYGTGYHGEEDS
jgi:hypothetical protein